MAAVCEVCGKHPSFGMAVSHSHRRTSVAGTRTSSGCAPSSTVPPRGSTSAPRASRPARSSRPSAERRPATRAGRHQVLRPETDDGTVLSDTDLTEYELATTPSRARSSGCSARASGWSSTSTSSGRAASVRMGSEVDIGTPGYPRGGRRARTLSGQTTNQSFSSGWTNGEDPPAR